MRRSDLRDSEVVQIHEMRVTGAVRTVADIARYSSVAEAVVAMDMALHGRLVQIDTLKDWICTHAGYRGIGRLRHAIGLTNARSESPMESRLRLLLWANGLPHPRVQVPLHDERGWFIARPDLLYPDHKLAIEYDGGTHRNSLAADNRRQNRLIEAGYRVLRFTAGDVLHTPAAVASLVRRALVDRFAELPAAGFG